jgi:hypothetical protein
MKGFFCLIIPARDRYRSVAKIAIPSSNKILRSSVISVIPVVKKELTTDFTD